MCKTHETGEKEAMAIAGLVGVGGVDGGSGVDGETSQQRGAKQHEMKKILHDFCSQLDMEVRGGRRLPPPCDVIKSTDTSPIVVSFNTAYRRL